MKIRVELVLIAVCAAGLAASGAGLRALPPSSAKASGYRKAYFGATVPGAWTRYAVTMDGKTETDYTYKRLPDENGQAVVELRVDNTGGQFKGKWSVNRYIVAKDYRLQDDALSFAKHCSRLLMQANDLELEEAADTLPYIVDAAIDYASCVKFAGPETIGGRACDRYTYSYRTKGSVKTDFKGEVWMIDSVPFGLVREAATVTGARGKPTKYSMTLVATGK